MALAASQVSQDYNVAAVTANVTAKDRPKDRVVLKNLGGHWLNLKDVHNSASVYKAANPDYKRIGTRDTWSEQVSSALKWFSEQNGEEEKWKACHISAVCNTDGETSEGLVFGHRERLRLLAKRGYLTLMDVTHNTNEMRWLLYTLMICQQHGK